MKIAFVVFAAVFAQIVSAAPSAGIFTGKFKTDEKLCPEFGSDRVYITQIKDYDGNSILRLNFYGTDSAIADVLLGEGSRQAPGTSQEFHGKVIQSWTQTFASPQHLVSDAFTVSDNGEYNVRTELILRGDRVTYIENSSDGYQIICKMDRAE